MSPWYAIGLGPLTQPWGLVAAGVAVIVEAKLSSWESYLVLVLFCLLATSSILILELLAGFSPERARPAVNAATRTWIDAHTDQAVLILSLVLGLWLLLDSIYHLVTTAVASRLRLLGSGDRFALDRLRRQRPVALHMVGFGSGLEGSRRASHLVKGVVI